MKAIEAKALCKRYGPIVALDNVSFDVERGDIVGLLGPNGAGKTTLMKLLTGYLQPDEGEAIIAGTNVVEDPGAVQAQLGYLPENAPVYDEMVVQEYLMMMADLRSIPDARRKAMLVRAIEATSLENHLTRPIGVLSKGYRQRVGIAQAILHEPQLLILDEPTSGLDPNQIVEIRDLIRELSKTATVMLSTHILSEIEMTCERVLVIMDGRLRANSPIEELRAAHARNAALVSIDAKASGVEDALRAIDGVEEVSATDEDTGDEQSVYRGHQDGDTRYRRWRVTSGSNDPLCPMIFEAIRDRGWRVAELRSDERSLEQVFRQLAETPEAQP